MIRSSSLVRGAARETRTPLAQAMITARTEADLTQREMAQLMYTSRSTVVRMESGRDLPLVSTLRQWAKVTGKRLDIRFI